MNPIFFSFEKFLEIILLKIRFTTVSSAAKIWLSPQEINSIIPQKLLIIEKSGLIKKCQSARLGYCSNCGTYNNISSNSQYKFFFCINCSTGQILKNNNHIKYFTSVDLLIAFLHKNLNLTNQTKSNDKSRLICLGQKERHNCYLLLDISLPDSRKIIKSVNNKYPCYIFHLHDHYRSDANKKIKFYSLLECFDILHGKLVFSIPKALKPVDIGKLGGAAGSVKRFGEARKFAIRLFKEKEKLPAKKKQEIYWEIAEEMFKRPDLISNLSEDNLFDWIAKQVRKVVKDRRNKG